MFSISLLVSSFLSCTDSLVKPEQHTTNTIEKAEQEGQTTKQTSDKNTEGPFQFIDLLYLQLPYVEQQFKLIKMQILWENETEGKKSGRYAYNKDECYFEIQTNTKDTIIDLTVFPSSTSDECAFGLKGKIPNLKEVKEGFNLSLSANNLVYDLVMFNPGNVEWAWFVTLRYPATFQHVFGEHATTGRDYVFDIDASEFRNKLNADCEDGWCDDEYYMKHYRDADNQELANKTWGDSPDEALSRPYSIRFYKDTTRD